ncbi:thioesterase II family protein [Parafrankia sp. FMc2]|uniref:thioesterase II family protein n=1 Tax=Parafrankia sp. FMc2 TaxID=3233196 RepID=UPI0034D65523
MSALPPETGGRAGRRGESPRLRLVVLPHAGGWPSAFRPWRGVLPPGVELLAGQFPGRGMRQGEPLLRRVEPLADGLGRALMELEPLPFAVVGHSFGSVVAYELTRALERAGMPPELLVVSARQAPCFPSRPPYAHLSSDADLLRHVLRIGGTPAELAHRTDLMRRMLPAIRADLEALETYRRPVSGSTTSMLALGAVDDPLVEADRLSLWSLETTGEFTQRTFSGGHFFIYQPEIAVQITRLVMAAVGDPFLGRPGERRGNPASIGGTTVGSHST